MDTERKSRAEVEVKNRVNSALLKYYIADAGDTMKSLAADMKVSPEWLSKKVNNSPGSEFWASEILFIKNRYKLSAEEVDRIFFSQGVSKLDTLPEDC